MSNKNRTAEDIDNSFPAYNIQQQLKNDEIDLKELLIALWKGKWIILLTTVIFAGAGVYYALSLPNIYKAEVVLAPAQDGGQSGLASMAAQFGGLASIAGINLGGGSADNKDLALAKLKSRKFINAFIKEHELMVPIMASVGWDSSLNILLFDEKIYDSKLNKWIAEGKELSSTKPTYWDAYNVFSNDVLSIKDSKDTGLVNLSILHYSPYVAKDIAEQIVINLNEVMKLDSVNETKRNINYLKKQLLKTEISEMRNVFYQLIEEQTKKLMLAEVESEYAFKIIDPPVVPEEKVGPRRASICIASTLIGFVLGLGIVMVRFIFLNLNIMSGSKYTK